jgi:hypothetical protein
MRAVHADEALDRGDQRALVIPRAEWLGRGALQNTRREGTPGSVLRLERLHEVEQLFMLLEDGENVLFRSYFSNIL